ncbi:Cuticle protein 16.8-like 2 [Homarus americanus]|uniref:Cuticle protein 16.8-like 2 n=1 Tax=Homarus americanus TaxID=6706 RepID=A0A8J5K5X9_HOMAM|nr:Cuticle protein 16.8-like 2 [Homarus americanus]
MQLLLLLGLVALVAARPDNVLNFDFDDFGHNQSIDDDNTVTGSYSWTSPEGVEYFVKYIADDDGFRIVESNAVPVGAGGLKADGTQVSFRSSEEFDTD